jgi:hypothetical protein
VDIDLGAAPIAEEYLHHPLYYLDKWNDILIYNSSAERVIYNSKQRWAMVMDTTTSTKIFAFSCHDASRVKGYYIVFRLLQNDVHRMKEYLDEIAADGLAQDTVDIFERRVKP